MLDPAADKLLVASLAIPMAVTGALPLWLSALIVGRDVGLMAVGFWHRFKTRARCCGSSFVWWWGEWWWWWW